MGRQRVILTAELLADRCFPEPNTGCWLYAGPEARGGYPKLKSGGVTYLAHRLMYELVFGPIPEGKVVCHSCDTPACMNPWHFWLGTIAQNNADRARKGRGRNDFYNGRCKEGHDLMVEGVYVCADRNGKKKLSCRRCNLDGQKRRRLAHKAA